MVKSANITTHTIISMNISDDAGAKSGGIKLIPSNPYR